jgi:rhodanese-related sulfurtransferase
MVEVEDTITGEPALVALAGPANRQGRVAADNICGHYSVYPSTQGSAIVKVFAMVGGSTGASERTLTRVHMPYRKVYLHPSGHASYYPGTAPMHMKLLFHPDTGKVLGAQVVYAPPFGAAKDPVNMAGFLAANVLRGDQRCWYAEDYPEKTNAGTLVDVRTAAEYDEWHIPGAINLPLRELRARLDEIPPDKPVFVYCRVGFRGYLAYRALVQQGFAHVFNLAGGVLTFSSFHRTAHSTGEARYPFVAHAEDEMAAQVLGATVS